MNADKQRSERQRLLALLCHFLLIAGLASAAGLSVGLLVILPLAAAIPGLWRRRSYTYAWASMMLAMYCAGLLAEAYMWPSQRLFWYSVATLSAIEFVSLVLFVRVQAAEARVAAARARSSAQTAA